MAFAAAKAKAKAAALQAKAKAQAKLKGNEDDPDPERLIYDWCKGMPVPEWKEKDSYASCHECGDNFKPNHQHNCRLCGELYCSGCTKKLHVPPQFKLKMKKGATRVCLVCVKDCLARKQEAEASGLVVTRQPGVVEQDYVLYPPAWEQDHQFTGCKNCGKTKDQVKSVHNCRICGWIHCSSCTTKAEVPPIFKHKPKPGPVRICESCDNRLKFGAILSKRDLEHDLTTAMSPGRKAEQQKRLPRKSDFNYNPDAVGDDGKSSGGGGADDEDDFARRLTAGASKHRSSEYGSPKAKVFINPAKSNRLTAVSEAFEAPSTIPAPVGGKVQLRFENSEENVMEVTMKGDETLQDIHRKFQGSPKFPEFRFKYLFRGDIVPDIWHDIVEVQHILPVLYIRKIESYAEVKAKGGEQAKLLAAEMSNPYSKEHRKDTAQEKKDREAYLKEQESKKPKFRKPGQNFKRAKMAVSKSQAKVTPKIRTGLVKNVKSTGGDSSAIVEIQKQDGESEFAARARYFASES